MEPVIANTKIRVPPARRAWVRRNVLLDRLQNFDTTLLLVRAPAGYGKSTLLGQLAHEVQKRAVAWVGLEQSENDPVVFWRCVLGALRNAEPEMAEATWVELNGPAPALERSVVPQLANDLADLPNGVLLILDDYHRISNPTIHGTMSSFLTYLPGSAQVAIGTRAVPGFPVSRMRSNGMMTEITSRDLAFRDEEIGAALQAAGWEVSDETTSGLRTKTEGWPTGVYLAAVAGSQRTSTSGTASVALREYLMEEMLDELSTSDRDFLRATSILDQFNGVLCDHLTGRTGSGEFLSVLASSNLLLVPLDEEGEWFRHHHLLQDVLRGELMRTNPDQVPRLHLRASRWLADYGAPSESIQHAIDADDLLRAAELVCTSFWDFYNSGRLATIQQWLEQIPDRILGDYPPLAVAAAFAAAFGGDYQRARQLCRVASSEVFADSPPDGHSSYESSVALLRSGLYPDGVADARDYGELAYSLETPDSPWRAYAAATYGSTLLASGDLESAVPYLKEAASSPDPAAKSYGLAQLAVVHTWAEDWDQAARHAREALQVAGENGLETMVTTGPAYAAAAAVAAHEGSHGLARNNIRSVSATISTGYPDAALEIETLAAEACLEMGEVAMAARHAQAAAAALETLGDGGYYADRLANVTAAIDRARPAESSPEMEDLTTREQEVLNFLPSDLSLREIGEKLYVSRNTVKTHTRRVYRKLGVAERNAAVTRAREVGLLPVQIDSSDAPDREPT